MRQRGLPAYFISGLRIVFETAARLLEAGRVPTVDRIKRSALQSSHHFTRMLEAGGKVEFALDALFNITENALVGGDCGWGIRDSKIKLKLIRPHHSMVRTTLLFSCV